MYAVGKDHSTVASIIKKYDKLKSEDLAEEFDHLRQLVESGTVYFVAMGIQNFGMDRHPAGD